MLSHPPPPPTQPHPNPLPKLPVTHPWDGVHNPSGKQLSILLGTMALKLRAPKRGLKGSYVQITMIG